MSEPSTQLQAPRTEQPVAGVALQMPGEDLSRAEAAEPSLRCVSSGYLADGCSCPASIPARVVAAAWERQRARDEAPEEGLFRFAWQGELWLAFAQAGGGIRGVCCPVHLAQRDARGGLAPAA